MYVINALRILLPSALHMFAWDWTGAAVDTSELKESSSQLSSKLSPWIWHMLWSTQQDPTKSGTSSILSFFRKHLHLPFSLPKACSTITCVLLRWILNSCCSAVSDPELMKGFMSHGNKGYAGSPSTGTVTLVLLMVVNLSSNRSPLSPLKKFWELWKTRASCNLPGQVKIPEWSTIPFKITECHPFLL